jgi:predicted hydrocarbon binding protein
MADLLTAGILGGMYSYFLGRDLDCMQTQCLAGLRRQSLCHFQYPRISKLRKASMQ